MNALAKIAAIIGASSFAGIFVWGALVQGFRQLGVIRNPIWIEPSIKIGVFALFCVFGFCCVPVVLNVFILAQGKIGNAQKPFVLFLQAHFLPIVIAVWAVFFVGLALGVLAAKGEFFGWPNQR